jgi:hypothetical protein
MFKTTTTTTTKNKKEEEDIIRTACSLFTHTHTHTHTYAYISTYFVCDFSLVLDSIFIAQLKFSMKFIIKQEHKRIAA